jgi:hypothetical protein
LIDLNQMPV